MTAPRLAIFLSFSGAGGVERMVLNLLPGLLKHGPPGLAVDLVAIKAHNVPAGRLPEGVRLVDAGAEHSTWAARPFARYLAEHRPDAVLAAKDRAIRAAVKARRRAGVRPRLVGRLGTNLSAALEGRSRFARWLRTRPMRRLYTEVDDIVAVSEGVAEDTVRVTGIERGRIAVIRNPVVTSQLAEQAREPVAHPWADGEIPLILGAGRLTRQKDFPTLLRAFARLRRERPARLVILGEGGERAALAALASELGIAADVDLVGHVANPYAWMARASLFVLSSAWEGSPNVLTEAIACGAPVVAANCPSGPKELLADGRYGPLVPVGDDTAMAAAMADTLDHPVPLATRLQAVAGYTVDRSARAYLQILGLGG